MDIPEMLNHAVSHVYTYLSGDRSEDHLAHAAWNLFGAMHSEELWPQLNEGRMRSAGCIPPDATPVSLGNAIVHAMNHIRQVGPYKSESIVVHPEVREQSTGHEVSDK